MTLFADKTAVVTALRANRLILAGSAFFNPDVLDEDAIYAKLLSSEAEVARRLRVLLVPTTVFAGEPSEAEIAALGEGKPWIEEPAYDYEPGVWTAEDWGYLVLRNKLVSKITSVEFVYPTPTFGIFQIPANWMRLDKKAGHVQFVPAGLTMQASGFGSMLMSMMSGGNVIPQMIKIRYVAGMADAARDYPDVIDLIKRKAVLSIIDDCFVPQSGSISADGLSQSFSADVQKFAETADAKLEKIRDSIHGIRVMVM